jgi:hypothetical protein
MPRILYVDDDPGLVRLAQRALGREGHEVLHAGDAEAAHAHLGQGGFGAVVLDHYLPQGTGLDILRALRERGDGTPAIYVTGSSEATVAVEALKAGADDYVIKTADGDFLGLLGRAVGGAIARAEFKAAKARADAETRAARERAETLLAEVHHRVANSLAMVTSLLRIQAQASESHEVRQALAEAQGRIGAVAGVHRSLYLGDDVRTVALDAYLEGVLRDFAATLPPQVQLSVEAEPLTMSADRAVSLGIIVTELATNAVKYAWPGGHPGRLVVRLEAEGHGRACLVVEDDGEGMDRGGTARGTGLGRRLVRAMTDTLGGTVETVPRQAGTCVAVRFPL